MLPGPGAKAGSGDDCATGRKAWLSVALSRNSAPGTDLFTRGPLIATVDHSLAVHPTLPLNICRTLADSMPRFPEERSSLMPMDFEYDNGNGPIDKSSPWVAHAAKKRKLLSFATSQPQSEDQVQQLNQGPPFGQSSAGTHSVFDSPSKNTFATPNHPKLSEPNNQSFLFSQRNLPQTPQAKTPQAYNTKLWSLRTPQSIADSSGGETPTDTPAQDSDAPTPDTQLALTMGGLSHAERRSPSKRASLLKSLGWNKSPSKEKSAREKPYSRKAELKVMKRRAHKSRSREYDSESESPTKDVQVRQVAPAIGFAAKIPGVLAWVDAHPNLPSVLSYYMQFIMNTVFGLIALWLISLVIASVRADIDFEAGNKVRDIMHEIALCAQEYERNGCEPRPVPAVEPLCRNWKQCKDRDAYKVARASVGARTFAMIFNSFVEEISYKSMVFIFLLLLYNFLLFRHWVRGNVTVTVVHKVRELRQVVAAHAQSRSDCMSRQPSTVPPAHHPYIEEEVEDETDEL